MECQELEPRLLLKISVQFDYTFDTGHFFADQARRDSLQAAADAMTAGLSDSLLAIQPTPADQWTAGFYNPTTGQLQAVPDLAVPADTLVIYVGAQDLYSVGSEASGAPGGVGFPSSPGGTDPAWIDTVEARGQAGALAAPPTDFGPWGGVLSFDDSPNTSWYFGPDPSAIGPGQLDFFTVVEHEIGHVLGIGQAPSWFAQVHDGDFFGPATKSLEGNIPVPLDAGHIHWATGTSWNNQVAIMSGPAIPGVRRYLTGLDLAGLADIGWQIPSPPVVAAIPDQVVDEGGLLTLTVAATDPGHVLTYSLPPGSPTGASIDPHTGVLRFTAPESPGRVDFAVRVADDSAFPLVTTQGFFATVRAAPPVVAPIPDMTFTRLGRLQYTGSYSAAGTDTWEVLFDTGDGRPGGVLLGPDKTFTLLYQFAHPGLHHLTVEVDNNAGVSGSTSFTVNVLPTPAADFEGTGTTDVGVYDPNAPGGPAFDYRSSLTGQLIAIPWGFAQDHPIPVLGDFEDTGYADVGIYDVHAPGGPVFAHRSTVTGQPVITPWGFAKDDPIPAVGDFEGTGTTDIGVYDVNAFGGPVFAYRSSLTGQPVIIPWGYKQDDPIPVVGDFDGAGKDEVGVYDLNAPGGPVFAYRSATGQPVVIPWGFKQDHPIPVVGDFEGTGRDDVGVYDANAPGGPVFAYRSASGRAVIIPWGYAQDHPIPVVGDFDGAGKAEVGVYDANAPGGPVLAYRSASGRPVVVPWGTRQDSPIPLASASLPGVVAAQAAPMIRPITSGASAAIPVQVITGAQDDTEPRKAAASPPPGKSAPKFSDALLGTALDATRYR